MLGRPELIAVRTEVVLAVLVDGIAEEVLRRLPGDDAGPAFADSAEPRLARAGWLSRTIERERFEPARRPCPWLADALGSGAPADPAGAVVTVSERLAAREPLDRPAPRDPDAATWRVPGPGGHVRHELALRAIADLCPGDDDATLKRVWTFGFLVRCGEDELAARRS